MTTKTVVSMLNADGVANGYIIATNSGTVQWVPLAPAWSSIADKPTTLAGYGITDANVTALAALNATPGLIYQTGAGAFSKRTIGQATGNVLDKAAGDALYLGVAATAANASQLNGQSASYYLDAANFTGTLSASVLPVANSSAGSYGSATSIPNFTVDNKGRLTAAGSVAVTPAWSSIQSKPTTIAGYGITDSLAYTSGAVFTGTVTLPGAPTQNLHAATKAYVDSTVAASTPTFASLSGKPTTISGYGITDPIAYTSGSVYTGDLTLANDPTSAMHAATKQYVDNAVQGLDAKASVRVATTANITLSATQTIDGIALAVNDRVLVKNQTTASQNGLYVVQSGAWTRATDADTWNELVSAFVFVESGSAGSDTGWVCTIDPGGTLGSTSVTWVQFSGTGTVTASNGIVRSGSDLQLTGQALALHNLATSGLIARTGTGTVAGRTLTGPAAGITVTNGNGVAGNPTLALANDLGAVEGISTTGFVRRTGTDTWTASAFVNADLPASGVTANTYRSVTVNDRGIVTAGTNPTTLAGYGITDALNKTDGGTVSGFTSFLGGLSTNSGFSFNEFSGNPTDERVVTMGTTGGDFKISFSPDITGTTNDALVISRTGTTPDVANFKVTELRVNANKVWHAGNDGTGSTLDADLLDGQEGSYYANIAARLGYTPVNAAGVYEDWNTKSTTARFAARHTNGPMGDAANTIGIHMPSDVSTHAMQIAGRNNDMWFRGLEADVFGAWNKFWHTGNHGSGSGLDADKLDTYEASAFPRKAEGSVSIAGLWSFDQTVHSAGPDGFRVKHDAGYYSWYNGAGTSRRGYMQHAGTSFAIQNEVTDSHLDLRTTGTGLVRVNGNNVWHAANLSPVDLTTADQYVPVRKRFTASAPNVGDFNANSYSNSALEVFNGDGNRAAFMSYHIAGVAGVKFGLNTNGWMATDAAGMTINGNTVWHAGNLDPNSVTAGTIQAFDTRAANTAPTAMPKGVRFDFKTNTTDSLIDGGTYHGVLSMRPYGEASDYSGGAMHQIGMTENGNLWTRRGDGAGWYAWNKIWHSGNDGTSSGLDADVLRGMAPANTNTGSTIVQRDGSGNITVRDVIAHRGDGSGVIYLNGAQTRYLHFDGANYRLPDSPLLVGNNIQAAGNVFSGASGNVQAGTDGFYQQTYITNGRNRIFSFGNATGHGISYNQGSAGFGGYDTITLHPNGQPGSFAAALTVDHFGRATFGPNARALSIGYSGGNYGGLGYNVGWTTTSDQHTIPQADTACLMDFPSGGMRLLGTGAGAAGRTASWTNLLQVPLTGNMSHRGSTVWTSGNHGPGSGLNADTVDGMHSYNMMPYNSQRDFTNGTLIVTDIDYSVTNGDVWQMEIKGNTYGSARPVNTTLQGYIYNGSMINAAMTQLGYRLTGVIAIQYGSSLAFWWPRQAYWHGYQITVSIVSEGYQRNRVSTVLDVAQPNSTKLIQFSGTSNERFIDYEVGSEVAYSIPSRDASGYMNQRVIRNLGPGVNDGMYIGYGNSGSGSGITRIYGGGSTYQGLFVTSAGAFWHDTGGTQQRIWSNGQIPTDTWQKDTGGHDRFHFGANSHTYIKTRGSFLFRNASDSDAMTLDGSGNMVIAGSLSAGSSVTASTYYTGNWYRSSGGTGWYSETFGGGIYMVDTTWVRTYNSKSFLTDGTMQCAAYNVTSDIRLKTEIEPLTRHAAFIDATNVYSYLKEGRPEWGILAQEVQDGPEPQFISEGGRMHEDGTPLLTVDDHSIQYAILAEVKDLRKREKEKDSLIAELIKRIEALENR